MMAWKARRNDCAAGAAAGLTGACPTVLAAVFAGPYPPGNDFEAGHRYRAALAAVAAGLVRRRQHIVTRRFVDFERLVIVVHQHQHHAVPLQLGLELAEALAALILVDNGAALNLDTFAGARTAAGKRIQIK